MKVYSYIAIDEFLLKKNCFLNERPTLSYSFYDHILRATAINIGIDFAFLAHFLGVILLDWNKLIFVGPHVFIYEVILLIILVLKTEWPKYLFLFDYEWRLCLQDNLGVKEFHRWSA